MFKEKIWHQRTHDPVVMQMLQKELNISSVLATMLASRRINDVSSAQKFLEPRLSHLREPTQFKDMEPAVTRIVRAIMVNEMIGIFGDYDVDGVCSAAILQEFFSTLQARSVATLPHRLTEGYGLSRPGIERLHARGATLLITVDCGILAHENIDYAKSLGFDVIVVDHHTVGETLPAAIAVINPKREDCQSEATHLCAAGLAFYLCLATRRALRNQGYFVSGAEPDVKSLLDLVALATVCDVVPLIHDNRALVKSGLSILKRTPRIGLKALMDKSGVDSQKISSTNLGFHLGPRINAAGRLTDAHPALELLLCRDELQALRYADALDDHNIERRSIEEETVKHIVDLLASDQSIATSAVIVLHDESWHPGVVGIVASRIAERFHRPTIIIGENGKGSGRSIKGVDLHAMVYEARLTIKAFGGHAHAIGVTLDEQGVAPFRAELLKVMTRLVPKSVYQQEVLYDTDVSMNDINHLLIDELIKLEPFGASNPYPIVRINHCFIRNLRRLEKGHIKGELENVDGFISFIGFRMDVADDLVNVALDVLGVIERNEWQGRVMKQLRIIDFKKSTCRA